MLKSHHPQSTNIPDTASGAPTRVQPHLICANNLQRSPPHVPPTNRRELLLASGAFLTSLIISPERVHAAIDTESPAIDIAASAFNLVATVGFLSGKSGDDFTALASAVIWSQGYVVTAYSPVNGALRQDKSLVIATQDQSTGIVSYSPVTSITAREPSLDLIVLQVDLTTDTGAPFRTDTIVVCPSKDLKIGQELFLIGSSPDGSRTLSAGILSATGRSIPAPNGQAIRNALQTDANVGNGINLGGALVDSQGHLVGTPTVSYSKPGTARSSGVNFALPSDTLIDAVPKLIAYGNLSGRR